MKLFNFLCISRPKTNILDIPIAIIPIFVYTCLIYGVKNLCMNFGKKEKKSKIKFRKGLISLSLFFISSALMLLLISFNQTHYKDPCNHYGPVYSVFVGITNIMMIFVSFYYLVRAIISIIKFLTKKDKKERKELLSKALRYFVIAILLFFLFFFLRVFMEIVVDSGYPYSWGECWC